MNSKNISQFDFYREGFNILLYGFGSKRQIINDFRMSMLEDKSVLVINGFFPGLTLKEVRTHMDVSALSNCLSIQLSIHLSHLLFYRYWNL